MKISVNVNVKVDLKVKIKVCVSKQMSRRKMNYKKGRGTTMQMKN